MTQYILRRILGFIPVLLTITLFTFVLMRAIPGGPLPTWRRNITWIGLCGSNSFPT